MITTLTLFQIIWNRIGTDKITTPDATDSDSSDDGETAWLDDFFASPPSDAEWTMTPSHGDESTTIFHPTIWQRDR